MAPMVGGIARGADFHDRTTEREKLWKHIAKEHILICGPRRLGKSSLVQRLVEEASDRDLHGVFIDLEGCRSGASMIDTMDASIPDGFFNRAAKKAWSAASGLTPSALTVGVSGATCGVSVEFKNKEAPPWFEKANALQQRLSEKKVLICLDEFTVCLDKMIKRDRDETEDLLAWLRAWRQSDTLCRFIFCGSIGINALLAAHTLTTAFSDCYEFHLGPFSPEAALEMLFEEVRDENIKTEKDTLAYLCRRVGWLSPFYLNLMLDEALRTSRERYMEDVTDQALLPGDVDAAYERLLFRGSRFVYWHQRLEKYLPEPQLTQAKAVLALVAKHDAGLTRKQIKNRLALQIPTMSELSVILAYLEEEGYLSQHDPVCFLSFLLRDYWKKHHAD
ncbi:hypothetical protein LJC71_09025 [Desulfosarcina sp. OttesenSCG-928-A07]|nr:hypothetical protein [Desulfosarcina sp. OttesenSCG-928-G17]MDL2329867.1 hypothetical protein [Desulfosarcina sp. OttesenSCG-928-A07]